MRIYLLERKMFSTTKMTVRQNFMYNFWNDFRNLIVKDKVYKIFCTLQINTFIVIDHQKINTDYVATPYNERNLVDISQRLTHFLAGIWVAHKYLEILIIRSIAHPSFCYTLICFKLTHYCLNFVTVLVCCYFNNIQYVWKIDLTKFSVKLEQ